MPTSSLLALTCRRPPPAPTTPTHPRPPQGLANTLWSFAKLNDPPLGAVRCLAAHMTGVLRTSRSSASLAATGGNMAFDAQALANAAWALAHLHSRGLNPALEPQSSTLIETLADAASEMLRVLRDGFRYRPTSGHDSQRALASMEGRFSCASLAHMAWAYGSFLGEALQRVDAAARLFACIRDEAVCRRVVPPATSLPPLSL